MLQSNAPKHVWIDSDPAFGDPYGDCDDGYAIIALLQAQNVEVVGLSSVFGNTGVDNARSKIRGLLSNYFPDYVNSVHQGDGESLVLNHHEKNATHLPLRTSDSVAALTECLEGMRSSGQRLHIVAIGALVNVATVLLRRPDLAVVVEEVVVVAGRAGVDDKFVFGNDPTKVFRDLNFDVDPQAMISLLAARVPVVLAGVEVARSMWLNADDLAQFSGVEGSAIAYMAQQSQDWLALWRSFDDPKYGPGKIRGFHPFDLFAAAWVINRDWFVGSHRRAELQVAADDTDFDDPPNTYKMYLVAAAEQGQPSEFQRIQAARPWEVYYLSDTVECFKEAIKGVLASA